MSASAEQCDISWAQLDSPIGRLTIFADGEGITEIRFPNNSTPLVAESTHKNQHLNRAIEQLNDYFDGHLKKFDLPLSLHGTDF